MNIRIPALAAFTLTTNESRTLQPPSIFRPAIHSSRLVQTLCWILVFFL